MAIALGGLALGMMLGKKKAKADAPLAPAPKLMSGGMPPATPTSTTENSSTAALAGQQAAQKARKKAGGFGTVLAKPSTLSTPKANLTPVTLGGRY